MRTMELPAAAGRRETRKAATRKELILAGRRLFGERGLYESRIEDLTTTAGIAKGTLYTYFADKNELIRAVAASGFAELAAFVERRVGKDRDDTEVLRRAIRAHLQFFAAHPDLMRVFHQLRGMLKFRRREWLPLRVALSDYLDALAAILARGPRIARLTGADRVELASLVFGAISGVTSVAAATRRAGGVSRRPGALVESLVAMASASIAASRRRPRDCR